MLISLSKVVEHDCCFPGFLSGLSDRSDPQIVPLRKIPSWFDGVIAPTRPSIPPGCLARSCISRLIFSVESGRRSGKTSIKSGCCLLPQSSPSRPSPAGARIGTISADPGLEQSGLTHSETHHGRTFQVRQIMDVCQCHGPDRPASLGQISTRQVPDLRDHATFI